MTPEYLEFIGIPPEDYKKIIIFETESNLEYISPEFILTTEKTKEALKKEIEIIKLKNKEIIKRNKLF